MSARRVVVAGASLGGLRAAEHLRAAGWTGAVTVIGNEPHMPYNRPPLSKEVLAGRAPFESLAFTPKASTADVEWRLGTTVTAARLADRVVVLDNGEELPFDGLVVATDHEHERPVLGADGAAGERRLDEVVAAGRQAAGDLLAVGAGGEDDRSRRCGLRQRGEHIDVRGDEVVLGVVGFGDVDLRSAGRFEAVDEPVGGAGLAHHDRGGLTQGAGGGDQFGGDLLQRTFSVLHEHQYFSHEIRCL